MTTNVRMAAVIAGIVLTAGALAACSSSEPADVAASAMDAASSAAAGVEEAGSADMVALCDQMVADGLTPEDAAARAEENGYVARVGTIDGVPQAVTMDFRTDRFTFDVENGVVVACTYG